jgi:DNA-directed RNA polymerase subunit RPC12/RpoP
MMQTFDFLVTGGKLRVERTYQEINVAGPVADEKWRATDSNGHEHHYADERTEAERGSHYSTLVYVPGPSYYCGDCGDEHEDYAVSHYECRICGEEVQPGSREPNNPEAMVLTQQAAYLNGALVSRERAEQLLSDWMTLEKNDGNRHEVRLG